MALAEANHHTDPRRQKTARAEATHDTSKAGDAVYFELFDEDTAGLRPGAVVDPRPQERVLQHTVEHEDAICPFVQILDALVPQLGEQLVHFFRSLDTQLPVEQVVDVPKISEDIIQPPICVIRRLRNSWWSCASLQQQTVEHIVNIPVRRGRWGSGGGGGGGLHGFLPGQSRAFNSLILVVHALPQYRVKRKVRR